MMTTAEISRTAGGAAMLLAGLWLGAAEACGIPEPSRYPGQDRFNHAIQNLLENRRVRQAPDCSFVNGGFRDDEEGGAAFDLGGERVGQMVHDGFAMVVTLCDERASTMIRGLDQGVADNCGDHAGDRASLDPATGKFDFRAGKDFAGFLAHMDRVNMLHTEDLVEHLEMVQAKDQVDLLCGCKVFYPETMN